jgi:glycosyltransferase involved in cell wall biosynthesis
VRLAVVIPCYNEAERLPASDFREEIARYPDWTWIFVNDGSSDATESVLQQLVQPFHHAHVVSLPVNQGKAEAVRQGLLWSWSFQPDWVGYLDADLATPVSEFARLTLRADENDSWQGIMGSRWLRLGAQIKRNPLRHYSGRLVAGAISLVLGLPTYDTQCGAKLFRADLAQQIFRDTFQTRWLFDVELLARCRNLLGRESVEQHILEEPLRIWVERPGTRIRSRDLVQLPYQIWQIHARYNRLAG